MEELIEYIYGTDEQILALTPESAAWKERAFYYPSDKTYFYQALNGVLVRYGGGDASISGDGIFLNGKVIGGVKYVLSEDDVLEIPTDWEYNVRKLDNFGQITNNGVINLF